MHNDTIHILSTLQNITEVEKLKDIFKNQTLNKKTKTFLNELIKEVEDGLEKWELNDDDIFEQSENLDYLPTTDNFDYIPDDQKKSIEKYCKYCLKFKFKTDYNHNIELSIVFGKEETRNEIYEMVRKTYVWFYMFQKYIYNMCLKNKINIYIYAIPDKKKFDFNGHINRSHVNTAFTQPCHLGHEIYIFRKEEWFRSLIHECFHHFKLDFQLFKEDERISNVFNIPYNGSINVNESFCECWAEILNNIIIICQGDSQDKIKVLVNQLFYEAMFSTWQCVKYLHNYKALYSNPDSFVSLKKEETPCFSYYVIKSVLMVNSIMFLKMVSNYTNPFYGTGRKDYFTNFNEFILDNFKSKRMMMFISVFEKTPRKYYDKRYMFFKTARMSLYEN